jgi:hypothetical protein
MPRTKAYGGIKTLGGALPPELILRMGGSFLLPTARAGILHTRQPRTAGEQHGKSVRFDLAVQRGAFCSLCIGCMGLTSLFIFAPPPWIRCQR